jgi:hypothetical protein
MPIAPTVLWVYLSLHTRPVSHGYFSEHSRVVPPPSGSESPGAGNAPVKEGSALFKRNFTVGWAAGIAGALCAGPHFLLGLEFHLR